MTTGLLPRRSQYNHNLFDVFLLLFPSKTDPLLLIRSLTALLICSLIVSKFPILLSFLHDSLCPIKLELTIDSEVPSWFPNSTRYRTIGFVGWRLKMNTFSVVKEEYPGSSSSHSGDHDPSTMMPTPRAMEGLHDTGLPPFLTKTFDMVDDLSTNHIVSWSRAGSSFVVWDPYSFSTNLLPRNFKHNNFSSFVRQLNTYGFRKIHTDRWEFANEGFLRGQKYLLSNIKRQKAPSRPLPRQQALDARVQVGRFGLDQEVDRLKRDKQVLMMELMKLRQQQHSTRSHIQAMEQRLQGTEIKQQQMMQFFARAIQNPAFIQQLVQHKEKRKELEKAMTKKRRRPINQGSSTVGGAESSHHAQSSNPIKAEPLEFENYGLEVSELEALALEMQEHGRARRAHEEGLQPPVSGDRELDERFWEELLNESTVGAGDEDVNTLAERLGYLGASPR